MIFLAFGLTKPEAEREVIKVIIFFGLGLDHPKYKIVCLPAISIYNAAGSIVDKDSRELWVLGLEDVQKYIAKKLNLTIDIDFPVTFLDAPVHTVTGGIIR